MSSTRRTCIYPGTFDPVTKGHLDVLERATHLFDEVIVAIAENEGKQPLFTAAEREALWLENLRGYSGVRTLLFRGLLVDLVHREGAHVIIRGLRALSDFEYEFQMALMNRHLAQDVETIFVMTRDQFSYTSSYLVKQVYRAGGDISGLVPPNVVKALQDKLPGTRP